mgnify:CR=1 FL=1
MNNPSMSRVATRRFARPRYRTRNVVLTEDASRFDDKTDRGSIPRGCKIFDTLFYVTVCTVCLKTSPINFFMLHCRTMVY